MWIPDFPIFNGMGSKKRKWTKSLMDPEKIYRAGTVQG